MFLSVQKIWTRSQTRLRILGCVLAVSTQQVGEAVAGAAQRPFRHLHEARPLAAGARTRALRHPEVVV